METRDGASGPLVVVFAAAVHLSVLRFIPFQSFVFNFFCYVDFDSEKILEKFLFGFQNDIRRAIQHFKNHLFREFW